MERFLIVSYEAVLSSVYTSEVTFLHAIDLGWHVEKPFLELPVSIRHVDLFISVQCGFLMIIMKDLRVSYNLRRTV